MSEQPFHRVSNFDHLVTQWMSVVISTDGRACSCAQLRRSGRSTRPATEMSHSARSPYFGTSPTCSTGKRSVKYCPGGRRLGSMPRCDSSLRFRSKKLTVLLSHDPHPYWSTGKVMSNRVLYRPERRETPGRR